MVVDFRQYTLKVGAVQPFLDRFQAEGLEPQLLVPAPCNPRIEGVEVR